MNKKQVLLTAFILALLVSAVAGTYFVNLVEANPINMKPVYTTILILSPQNETYNENTVLLTFEVRTNFPYHNAAYTYWCSFDEQERVKVEQIKVDGQVTISSEAPYEPYTEYILEGNAEISNLSNGQHNLTAYVIYYLDTVKTSETIYFTIAQETEPEQKQSESQHSVPFPTWIVATIAVVGAGLLVYFAKVKKTTEKAE